MKTYYKAASDRATITSVATLQALFRSKFHTVRITFEGDAYDDDDLYDYVRKIIYDPMPQSLRRVLRKYIRRRTKHVQSFYRHWR
jgi:hypothetical protein